MNAPDATESTRNLSRDDGWREDLAASRDVSERDKAGFHYVLGWLESWRG